MASNLQMTFHVQFMETIFLFLIEVSPKFVSVDTIDQ